jgi:hypothetical protein
VEALESLFCERVNDKVRIVSSLPPFRSVWLTFNCCFDLQAKRPSRINPHLSLSLIRTLSLGINSPSPPALALSLGRSPSSDPLPLDCLHITYHDFAGDILDTLHSDLLPLLNPVRLGYEASGAQTNLWADLEAGAILTGWTRLEVIELKGFIPVLPDPGEQHLGSFLAAQPSPCLDRRRTVRLDVVSLLNPVYPTVRKLLAHLEDQLDIFPWELLQHGSVALVVRSEAEKKTTEAAMRKVGEEARRVFSISLEP